MAEVPRQGSGATDEPVLRDVVFLVADSNMRTMIGTFLSREDFHYKLNCAPFVFDRNRDFVVAPTHDSGIPLQAGALLQSRRREYERAIVVMDHAYDNAPPVEIIRKRISSQLEDVWPQFKIIVIEPELENWFWSSHTEYIKKALVWKPRRGDERTPREVLEEAGLWLPGDPKPGDPKGAVEHLHKMKYIGDKSGGIFARFAATVPSVRGCTDASFQELMTTLADWFPADQTQAYTTTEYAQ
ncbi:methylation-associated defense system protein MAD4 [Streptomyces massasporeus]|uniref:methylation-associated defense system protein MAD4 n=1 Tax=Streptomyces massasporeus TaxID=67324 RepID=UPI0033DDE9D8